MFCPSNIVRAVRNWQLHGWCHETKSSDRGYNISTLLEMFTTRQGFTLSEVFTTPHGYIEAAIFLLPMDKHITFRFIYCYLFWVFFIFCFGLSIFLLLNYSYSIYWYVMYFIFHRLCLWCNVLDTFFSFKGSFLHT